MQLRVQGARGLLRQPGDALELLLGRVQEPLHGAEVPEDRATPRRATPGSVSKIVSIARVPRR